jgi:hypothetical protein
MAGVNRRNLDDDWKLAARVYDGRRTVGAESVDHVQDRLQIARYINDICQIVVVSTGNAIEHMRHGAQNQ